MGDENKVYLRGMWAMLHRWALTAEGDEYKHMIPFVNHILPRLLGCEECEIHCKEYLKTNSLESIYKRQGYNGVFNYFVDFHNAVNARLRKPQFTHSQARAYWEKGCVDCKVKVNKESVPLTEFLNQITNWKE